MKEKFISYIMKRVGKALGDYQMLSNDDRILVSVSGGKDSLTLLDVMLSKRDSFPFRYKIYAAFVDFGFYSNEDLKNLEWYLKSLSIEYYFIQKELKVDKRGINCFWCSWNRRKEIFLLAKKLGCNKVALGHTLDDVVVTFLMNLFYHGEISTMPPILKMFGGEITLIRPLVYLTSEETEKYAQYRNLPVNKFKCPYYNNNKKVRHREYLNNLLKDLQVYWPNIKQNIFNSLKKIKKEYLV